MADIGAWSHIHKHSPVDYYMVTVFVDYLRSVQDFTEQKHGL